MLILALLVLLVPSSPHTAEAATTGSVNTGIMIPLYSYPGADWNNLIWAKQVNPNVPVVAVINPDGGPGWSRDPDFVTGIARLQAAGVTVLGYVWTDYGARSLSSVETAIATYASWYHVNGIYFDQMANKAGYESYYSTLTAYTKSLGMTMTVGNPGTMVPSSYIGTVTTMIIYEHSGVPASSYLSQLGTYGKNNFALIAYDVPSVNTAYLDSAAKYVGYVYLTDGIMPNPYAPESSYLDNLATALDVYDQAQTGSSTQGTITVVTDNLWGQALPGLHMVLWNNGAIVEGCFSPCTFTVSGGQSYQVEVSNYGPFVFSHWGNGLQSRYFSVIEPSSATQLHIWAFYET
jgi:hypothetical protein